LHALQNTAVQERAELAEQRFAGHSRDGLASVLCDGTGAVRRIEFDQAYFRRVGSDVIERAVLSAMAAAGAGGLSGRAAAPVVPAVADAIDDPAVRERIGRIARQYQQADQRLADETVTGWGPRSGARCDYDGFGHLLALKVQPSALRDLTFPQLADDIVQALRSGRRAADDLREKVLDAVVIDGDTVANWRRYPKEPAELVRRAFAAGASTDRW
jgi:DNA-binding protein YbaB